MNLLYNHDTNPQNLEGCQMDKKKRDLKVLLNQEIQETSKLMQSINWKDPKIYSDFLAQTYYYVCHSTKLLKYCAARVDQKKDHSLYEHLMNHIKEENNHERLCINDMKKTNSKIEDFPEYESTKSLYQVQYYSIEHLHELSFFGYVLFLETLAITHGQVLNQFIVNNYAKNANSFLRVHAEEDIEHSEQMQQMIRTLSKEAQEHIYDNLRQSAYLYRQVLREILNHSLSESGSNDQYQLNKGA